MSRLILFLYTIRNCRVIRVKCNHHVTAIKFFSVEKIKYMAYHDKPTTLQNIKKIVVPNSTQNGKLYKVLIKTLRSYQ